MKPFKHQGLLLGGKMKNGKYVNLKDYVLRTELKKGAYKKSSKINKYGIKVEDIEILHGHEWTLFVKNVKTGKKSQLKIKGGKNPLWRGRKALAALISQAESK